MPTVINPYVPILKAKEGEFTSFPSLDPRHHTSITPLFEILPIGSEEDVDGRLEYAAEKLEKNLANWPVIMVDLGLVDPAVRTRTGLHPVESILNRLRASGVDAIPVTGVRRDAAYQAAVRKATAEDGMGLCLRLDTQDLARRDLAQKVDTVLSSTKCEPGEVHLLLDFGALAPDTGMSLALTVQSLLPRLHRLEQWASVTVAGSSFPESMAGITPDSIKTIERAEWTAWNHLQSLGLPRSLGFGDYAIANPKLPNVDFRMMSMSASIRYTINGDYLCFKGRGLKKGGSRQYHQLSKKVISHPDFSGRTFSEADTYIFECAYNREGPGNATTWRWVGNVHHLTMVAQEIASLS